MTPLKKVTLSNRSLKLLSMFNENKLKIILLLMRSKDNECGVDISKYTNIQKSLLTYHISTLEQLGIIDEIKCGRYKHYKITSRFEPKIRKLFEILEIKI